MTRQEKRSAEEVELVWEAPKQRAIHTNAVETYGAVLDQVKQSPGRWGRVRVFPGSGGAYSARKSLTKALNGDAHWEVKVSVLDGEPSKTGRHGLYVRYRTAEQLKAAKSK